MPKLPTVHDVARVAGVSRQTVSNVLNSPDIVRPDTRERVQRAIETLGYRPHASARRLRTQKSSTIGIRLDPMVDGISGSILDRFLHALTEQADAVGLRILLFTATSPEDEIRQFGRLVDGSDVDAFVLTSTFYGDPRTEWLIDHGQTFVTFGRPWGIDDMNDLRHSWVDVDGRAGVRAATESMLARGFTRVGFLGWPSGSGTGDERAGGWQDAMTAAGLDHDLDRLRENAVDTVAAAREASSRLAGRVGDLEAVVAASDSLALGAVVQTQGGLPVVGFDNTPVSTAMGFSSVDQRLDDVAHAVLELLTDSGADTSRHRLVTPELVVRSSHPPVVPDAS
ncbi:LacI family DNA-binding transcriptional regulator [Planctomonas sp. JC2975]|uniref:LacI family DNA-binding transcriptional regulator n=1 Tax=Planctomonas sp. JC2975 TaxID=2729626 RepID=UPI001472C072|nr:LacI family DNA-binding transcriptional regulator [Planctomonas sp. JC2975]NNC12205.1 LacI family DNA-binding transcriptional regulator [Planctomonas sp. JC2975]